LAQFEVLARAFVSESMDYCAKSSSVARKFEGLNHSAEVLFDAIGSLAKRELLEKLDTLLDGLDALIKDFEELKHYSEAVMTRGEDLMTRYPTEAYQADIPKTMRTLTKLEHSRRRLELLAEYLKLRLLRIKEKVQ